MMYRCPTCGAEAQWLGNIRRHIRKCMSVDGTKKTAGELRIPGRKRPPRKTSRGEKTAVKPKRRRGRRGKQGRRLLDWRRTTETLEQKKAQQRKGRDDKFAYWVRSRREMPEWCARRLTRGGTTRSLGELRDAYVFSHPVPKRRNTPRDQRRLQRRQQLRSAPPLPMVPHAAEPLAHRAEVPPVPPHTQSRPPLPHSSIPGTSVNEEAKIRCEDLLGRIYDEHTMEINEVNLREVEEKEGSPSFVMATDRPPPEPPPPPDAFIQLSLIHI